MDYLLEMHWNIGGQGLPTTTGSLSAAVLTADTILPVPINRE